MVGTRPFVYVDPPAIEPYRHGLLDAAQELTPPASGADHWTYGGIQYESLAAYASATYPGAFDTPGGAGGTKLLATCVGATTATGFTVYGGVQTGSVGHNENDNAYWTERARRIVELSAQHAVETAVWTGSGGGSLAFNAAGTTLAIAGQANTTGGAVDMVTGLGILEGWLADHYAGRGLIHGQRRLAAHMAQLQQIRQDPDNEQVLTSVLGTRFVFGGGYDGTGPGAVVPPASAAGVNYSWLYVTGQMMYLRGEIETPADFGQALNRATNQVALLAEQEWLAAADGGVIAAVLVKTPTIA